MSFVKQSNANAAATIISRLQKRNMEGYFCETSEEAVKKALSLMPEGSVISWGGSMSISECGLMDAIRENGLEADMIFACGPTPMLRAIKEYAEKNNIVCYLSLEERMACGIGACLACVCQTKEKDHHSNVNNKRICKDGPVFLSTEVEI